MLPTNHANAQTASICFPVPAQPSICFPKATKSVQRPTIPLVLEDLGQRLA